MSLKAGSKLGPYEIVAPLGAGGMGEVYRARDTRLDRTVAIKILPAHLSEKLNVKQRFEREARAISSLQHPHICTLYDVGHDSGTDFLVMEYLEGESLAKRLEKGPLDPEQTLKIGIEICEGLAAAHQRGVVHRDLKPGNVVLTRTGAKLLDFGLAKPLEAAPAASLTGLPTASKAWEAVKEPVTAEGTIVGTFQYMSPEQLEGREADARSDIFALGAVLYEMATGKRAFEGKSQASVIAAILEREPPPVSQLQPMSPPALDRVVKACLTKDPEARFQSAHDVGLELRWIAERGGRAGAAAPLAARRRISTVAAWAIAAVCFAAAMVLAAVLFLRAPPQPSQMVRASLMPPAGTSFLPYSFSVSPDGTHLAFVATEANGQNALWVRSLSAPNAQKLDGTTGAIYPFWSPDSRTIGFFAEGKLETVAISGGAARILCDAPAGRGGAWNRDGVIVFAPSIFGPLDRIPDTGGVPVPVTKLARAGSGQAHRWPYFLPDGKHFLYFVDWSNPKDTRPNGIYAGSLEGGPPKLVSSDLAGNVEFASGYLLYVRDRSLMAQPFDARRLETAVPPVSVAEQEVGTDVSFSQSGYSVSENGVLVFQSMADSASRLAWFDSNGKELGQLPTFGYGEPRISPDGRFVAYDSDDDRNGKSYIRVYDLARGISTRLTDGGDEMDPAWSPDGKRITYVAGFRSSSSIYDVPADGSGSPQLLLKGAKMLLEDWALNGHMVFSTFANGLPALEVYSSANRQVSELGVVGAEAMFSPDGKWIACGSANGILVLPFPGPGGRVQVSNGGAQPVWSRDGKRLFYIAPDKKLMEADFDPRKGRFGASREVFQTRIIASHFVGTQYDVAPDGRFLINSLPAERSSPLTLVTNWPALLKKQ
jgi:eukaryotic-like serine/threonine-protein kinase